VWRFSPRIKAFLLVSVAGMALSHHRAPCPAYSRSFKTMDELIHHYAGGGGAARSPNEHEFQLGAPCRVRPDVLQP
jgi:hypothetical protein